MGYIETTTAPGGIIVRIQKAKKFLRYAGPEGAKSFPQARAKEDGKLWKSPPATAQPVLEFADPLPKTEEGSPQICGGGVGKSAENAPLAARICSRAIEREIETTKESQPEVRKSVITSAQTSNPDAFCLEKNQTPNAGRQVTVAPFAARNNISPRDGAVSPNLYATRRLRREEEVARELKIGMGPEVR